MPQKLVIKPEKAALIKRRHPWIFSGALFEIPKTIEDGEVCELVDNKGDFLAIVMAFPRNSIAARVLSYEQNFDVNTYIFERLKLAKIEKKQLVPDSVSNAFRLINAEADGIPGLIIDIYDSLAVLQISLVGIDSYKQAIADFLNSQLGCTAVIDRSQKITSVLVGSIGKSKTIIVENGIRFAVDAAQGQKTGFFIDQREMRLLLREISKNKKILNAFCYSGGFSFNALKGGAKKVVSLDSSASACELLQENLRLNEMSTLGNHELVNDDVYVYLKTVQEKFDIIVLDPPPYVKKSKDLNQGLKHYLELNRLALKKLERGGILLSFSCSPFTSDADFLKMLMQAASFENRTLKIITQHRHALDHGVLLSHPEGRYLKGYVVKEVLFA
ncbi:MAG: class I SAM-dependent rRNA methyltransferase [Oligoflexales bacterium]|nr:class I SAM-dependent rRNA methyltransferase [Oligoflexales bacterium]